MEPISLIASFALPILGGLLGQALASGDQAEADRLYRMAAEQYNIDPPTLQKIAAEKLGPTEFGNIKEDPSLRGSQMDAISRFEQLSRDGLDARDRADLYDIESEQARATAGNRAANLSAYARRGGLNSGMQLMADLQGGQAASENAGRQGMQVAAQGQGRRVSALDRFAGLAGGVRDADYERFAKVAAANDYIKQLNAKNSMDAQLANREGSMWEFDQKRDLARDRKAEMYGRAARKEGAADRTRSMWGGIGQAGGEAAQSFGEMDWKKKYLEAMSKGGG